MKRLTVCMVSFLASGVAQAQVLEELALTFPDASVTSYYPTVTGTDSYNVTPLVDIAVTDLCYYDPRGVGMTQDHPVALYSRLDGFELAYTVVTANSRLVDNFRCEPIPPVVLNAGVPYQMGGFTYIDDTLDWAYAVSNLGMAPSIQYDGYTNEYDGVDVVYVDAPTINIYFFGPNFLITTDISVADPDPCDDDSRDDDSRDDDSSDDDSSDRDSSDDDPSDDDSSDDDSSDDDSSDDDSSDDDSSDDDSSDDDSSDDDSSDDDSSDDDSRSDDDSSDDDSSDDDSRSDDDSQGWPSKKKGKKSQSRNQQNARRSSAAR